MLCLRNHLDDFHNAAIKNDIQTINKYVKEYCIECDNRDDFEEEYYKSFTALMYATLRNNVEAVEILLPY